MKSNLKKSVIFFVILFGLLSRIIPHPPNFVPINAIGLFSGSRFGKALAIIIPLSIMIISDMILGFHSTMIFVYFSLFATVLLGSRIGKFSIKSLFLYSLISSMIFFLITNFGVWLLFDMYPKTLSGLVNCYTMAIPFFGNTILGDLFYTYVVFYGFRFVERNLLNKIRDWGTL